MANKTKNKIQCGVTAEVRGEKLVFDNSQNLYKYCCAYSFTSFLR